MGRRDKLSAIGLLICALAIWLQWIHISKLERSNAVILGQLDRANEKLTNEKLTLRNEFPSGVLRSELLLLDSISLNRLAVALKNSRERSTISVHLDGPKKPDNCGHILISQSSDVVLSGNTVDCVTPQ